MFPFKKIRPVQNDFMKDVKYAIENSMNIIANAPTGLGKTAAVLSPALEFALENNKTILFLTPRHSQHQIALETLKKIKNKSNRNFYVSDLIGKKWLCSVNDVENLYNSEFNEFCKALRNEERCSFFNATRNKHHILKKEAKKSLTDLEKNFYHAEEAKKSLSEKFCTYEILSELAKKSNVIIGDYYHFFSPVRNSFLTRIGKNLEDLIVIVDEAHNLPERIRNIASMKLTSFILKKSQNEAETFGFYDETGIIEGIETAIKRAAKEKIKNGKDSFVGKNFILDLIENEIGNIEKSLNELNSISYEIKIEQKKSYISSVVKFLDLWTETEKGYAKIISQNDKYFSLSNKCLEPSIHSSILNECYASVLMSGTLLPLDMHFNLLGLKNSMLKSYDSQFPQKNRLNIIVKDTTTKYSKRTEENFAKISDYVVKCCSAIKGNCAVFFPSYFIRDIIFDLSRNKIDKTILLEKQGSNKSERKKLYDRFVKNYAEGSVLFGVISGSFDEGMDLPGKYLNGVVVVGIPLSRPDLELTALIDYYEYKFNRGWDYGYIYPAMIRCLQAAGRAIRSENDRGIIVFIDERFTWSNYRKVFPSDMNIKITTKPENLIKEFVNK